VLTVVPTPIGNLEDMTPRALRALKEARAVYCEDTRRTRQLMSHFGLSTPLLRYNEQDPRDSEDILRKVRDGQAVALVSDGGLPGVSDPGCRVVAQAHDAGLPVSALPGPSAVVTALAGSGLPAGSFVFLGFLPRTASKQVRELKEAAVLERTIVCYESPFRLLELLENAEAALGPKAQCCVARELSKLHEEWLTGTVADVRAKLASRGEIKGECVALFHPKERPTAV
jgi:16S rRNA (cytidine1402-2'-O)-methyltransferase